MDSHLHVSSLLHKRLSAYAKKSRVKMKPLVEKWLEERLALEETGPAGKKRLSKSSPDATKAYDVFERKPFWDRSAEESQWEKDRKSCARLAQLREELQDLPPSNPRWVHMARELHALEKDLGLTQTTRIGALSSRETEG